MSKNKQQKKKDREKRVAQKKHAATIKRMQAQAAAEAQTSSSKTKKVFSTEPMAKPPAVPKTSYVAANTKSNFTQRRSGS